MRMRVARTALYMRSARTRMRFLAYFALFVMCCAALEIEVRANKDGKLSYQQYLTKVRHFFNVTGA